MHAGEAMHCKPCYNRQQAIIWSNGGKFTEAYMRHSASMS